MICPHVCVFATWRVQVMLKDVADSRRLNARAHAASEGGAGAATPLSPTSAAAAAARAAAAGAAAASAPQLPPRGRGGRGAASGVTAATPSTSGRGGAMPAGGGRGSSARTPLAITPAARGRAGLGSPPSSMPPPPPPPAEPPPPPEFELLSALVVSYLFWPRQDDRDQVPPPPGQGPLRSRPVAQRPRPCAHRWHPPGPHAHPHPLWLPPSLAAPPFLSCRATPTTPRTRCACRPASSPRRWAQRPPWRGPALEWPPTRPGPLWLALPCLPRSPAPRPSPALSPAGRLRGALPPAQDAAQAALAAAAGLRGAGRRGGRRGRGLPRDAAARLPAAGLRAAPRPHVRAAGRRGGPQRTHPPEAPRAAQQRTGAPRLWPPAPYAFALHLDPVPMAGSSGRGRERAAFRLSAPTPVFVQPRQPVSPCRRPQVGLPQPLVRRRMLFWVAHGVVSETRSAGGGREVQYRRAEALPPALQGGWPGGKAGQACCAAPLRLHPPAGGLSVPTTWKRPAAIAWLTCRTPVSHPRVTPPCHTPVSHPRVAPPCHTPVSHPRVTPPCHTPVSHPRVRPVCLQARC